MDDIFNEINTKATRYFNVSNEEEQEKCRICLSPDHSERSCSFNRIKNCFACGKLGHESVNCVYDRRNINEYLCKNRICYQSPHFFEECPLIWRYYVVNNSQKIRPQKTCCINCGSKKHQFEECNIHPIKTNRTPFTETIDEFLSLSGIPYQYTTDIRGRPWNNLTVLKQNKNSNFPARKRSYSKNNNRGSSHRPNKRGRNK